MSRRKLEDRNIRKLYRTGRAGSICVTLPVGLVRKLGWKSKQKVVISQRGKSLVIRDWE